MNKKILFIQPTPYDRTGQLIKKRKLYFVGLALPLLAALTPKDWQCEICLETIESVDFNSDADVIAISSMGHAVMRTLDLAKAFKAKGKTVILGGYMVSLMPDEASQYADTIVVGDADDVWHTLLDDLEKGQLKKRYQQTIRALAPPLPRFDLILDKNIGNFLPVQAGRGCPNACSFCSVYCLYKTRYYQRPIDDVVRDILQVKQLGFKRFLLLDDNIMSDRDYMLALCKAIAPLNMKWMSQCSVTIGDDDQLLDAIAKSGCIALSFGLESISQESLNSMQKAWAKTADYPRLLNNIRRHGIDLSSEMVVGADGDTVQSIMQTADFIEQNKIVVPRFYILTPIPGTEFYEQVKRENRLYITDIYAYDSTEAVHIPKNMSPQTLTNSYWALYRKVFSLKSIVKRTLWRRDFLKRPLNYLFYFSVNLYYRHQIKRFITPNII